MIQSVKLFFERYVKPPSESSGRSDDHSLQIATAALLIEMMRADTEITDDEQKTIQETIQSRFSLSQEETDSLMELAEDKIWHATGYFEFTSLLNSRLSHPEKIKVIEYLWEVAYADGILDKHEEYMVRKIADLIYVSHRDFIGAKLKAKGSRL